MMVYIFRAAGTSQSGGEHLSILRLNPQVTV